MARDKLTDTNYPLIDTHCHIDMIIDKGLSIEEIESELLENRIESVIQIAADPVSLEFSSGFCHKNSGKIQYYYTIGLHPNEAHELDVHAGLNYCKEKAFDERFVGVGEIGLDYYYGMEHREVQLQTFELYLDIARQLKKPVVVHTRNAHEDTLRLLKPYTGEIPVLIHCFTGNKKQMSDYLNIGALISFSGIVTFKNAQDIREAAMYCPLEKMAVETDGPFLAPVPHRGKVNRPSWVKHVADFLSQLRGFDLSPHFYENSRRFFNLPVV